jgi:hypothetical protein
VENDIAFIENGTKVVTPQKTCSQEDRMPLARRWGMAMNKKKAGD